MAVRNDKVNYMPPALIARFEEDLAGLMMFLGDGGRDSVVATRPDDELLEMWFGDGAVPRFVSPAEGRAAVLCGEPLVPWGQSRAVLHKYGLVEEARAWSNRELLSRRTSVAVEETLRSLSVGAPGLGFDAEPRVVSSRDELSEVLRREGGGVVLKSLWSSSGRGVMIGRDGDDASLTQWGERAIASDGAVVVERKLAREEEMTFLFRREDAGEVVYVGQNRYCSAENGRFGKEIVTPSEAISGETLSEAVGLLCEALRKVLTASGYVGPIGVDAMTYRREGRLLLRPSTEVNMRHTMGNVGVAVRRRMAEGVSAWWQIGQFGSEGEWRSFCAEAESQAPLERDGSGKMTRGFFRLTGLTERQRFAAYGWVGNAYE